MPILDPRKRATSAPTTAASSANHSAASGRLANDGRKPQATARQTLKTRFITDHENRKQTTHATLHKLHATDLTRHVLPILRCRLAHRRTSRQLPQGSKVPKGLYRGFTQIEHVHPKSNLERWRNAQGEKAHVLGRANVRILHGLHKCRNSRFSGSRV